MEKGPVRFKAQFMGRFVKYLLFIGGFVSVIGMGWYAYDDYMSQRVFNAYEDKTVFVSPEEIERAISRMPDNPRGWKVLGEAYYSKAVGQKGEHFERDIKKSTEAYKIFASLAPTRIDAWLDLGRSQLVGGEIKEGLKSMERGSNLSAPNRDICLYMIINYLRAAEYSEDSEAKQRTIDKAVVWVRKTHAFKQPLILTDFDYRGSSSQKLEPKDRLRVVSLLQEIIST